MTENDYKCASMKKHEHHQHKRRDFIQITNAFAKFYSIYRIYL